MIEDHASFQATQERYIALQAALMERRSETPLDEYPDAAKELFEALEKTHELLVNYLRKHVSWDTPAQLNETHSISVYGPLRVEIQPGPSYHVAFELDEALRPFLSMELYEGALRLSLDSQPPDPPDIREMLKLNLDSEGRDQWREEYLEALQAHFAAFRQQYPAHLIRVTLPNLREVRTFSGAHAVIKDFPRLEEIKLGGGSGSGSFGRTGLVSFENVGDIALVEVTAGGGGGVQVSGLDRVKQLRVSAGGGGRIKLSGQAEAADVSAGGGGRIDMDDCQVQDMALSLGGGGQAQVWVEGTLNREGCHHRSFTHRGGAVLEGEPLTFGPSRGRRRRQDDD